MVKQGEDLFSSSIYVPESSDWSSEVTKAKKLSLLAGEKRSAMTKLASTSVHTTAQFPYPSSMLSLSDMTIPRTLLEVMKWCRYFYKFDPLISGAINALASFPVTEVNLEDVEVGQKPGQKTALLLVYEKMLYERLNIHKFLIEVGIDYFLYGNCFVFGEFGNISEDPNVPDIQWKSLTRLDPSRVIIDVDSLTQERSYKWEVPPSIKRICLDRKPTAKYNAIPDIIKEAVAKKKAVVLNENNIYHFSRASESGDGSVWGTPIVLNVLKLLMYRNTLRQAQEAIAREHIVPFRIYYLNPTDRYDPVANWGQAARGFAEQLKISQIDPNYKVVSPVPVDVLNLGGQGRSLLLTPEIEQIQGEILAGMGVPREFIFGGVSYSGSSISLRILENQFITYRLLLVDFIKNFIIKKMAQVRGEWRSSADDQYLINVKLGDLKMQDDIQQKQLMINLNAAGKIPDENLYDMLGLDPEKTERKLQEELVKKLERERMTQLYTFQTQMEMQRQQMQMQLQAQAVQAKMFGSNEAENKDNKSSENKKSEPKEDKKPTGTSKTASELLEEIEKFSESEVFGVAKNLASLDQSARNIALSKLPESLKGKVVGQLGTLDAMRKTQQTTDMRKLPEIKPPRRKTTII